jgi:small subunit ribosomal protein S20
MTGTAFKKASEASSALFDSIAAFTRFMYAQARKRARQGETRRIRNASQRSMARTYIKRVNAAIESNNAEEASEAFLKAVPVIDKMITKGILHKNQAARYKSRLNKKIKALAS